MAKIIYIGADHAGFKLKEKIKDYLEKLDYSVRDEGNLVYDKLDDFPDYAFKVAKRVVKEKVKGILICGTGQGVCVAANKVKGVRAYYAFNKNTAAHASKHGNANILCLGGFLKEKKAKEIIKTWLGTKFSKMPKYTRRIKKLKKIEKAR